MHFAGIDIGSRAIKIVIIDEQGIEISTAQSDTGCDPISNAERMLNDMEYDHILATGYGRALFEIAFEAPTVTEIKAHATAAWTLFPGITTILDIGGQDSKAIALLKNGKIKKFEMNDRCAAGTGKFLEIMARNLGFSVAEFGNEALKSETERAISSMCTVFAESEVTSLIAKGANRYEIARGLHDSVVRRAAAMLGRISDSGDILFTGGVAQNSCIVHLLAQKLQRRVTVPPRPQSMGALGAALLIRQDILENP